MITPASPSNNVNDPSQVPAAGSQQDPNNAGNANPNGQNANNAATNPGSDGSIDSPTGWVPWFCAVPGHEFFTEVDEDYIRDNFNLYGLRNRVQYYEHA